MQPQEEREFLADLAARKLGVTVTAEEAKTIYNLSLRAVAARTTMQHDVSNVYNRIAVLLTTHEVDGVTARDLALAKIMDAVFSEGAN